MSALPGVRRRRTAIMLVANLLALVALGGIGYTGVRALKRYEGATKVTVESIKLPVTPVGMFATVDADNQLTSVAVFVLTAGSQLGGSIITVPVSSDSTAAQRRGPHSADAGIRRRWRRGLGPGRGECAVAHHRRQHRRTAQRGEALLAPVAPVTATLPTDVLSTATGGDTDVMFPAGATTLAPPRQSRC